MTQAHFDEAQEAGVLGHEPLATRMRPRSLDEFVGQSHLMGEGKVLRRSIERDQIGSMILWGPPGSGKTTLANVVARATRSRFIALSAASAGVADLRRAVDTAKKLRRATGERTIVFLDEIHRFNKAQQDAILPHVEDGTIILIGATTENPSFEVNSALLSRSRVFPLKRLDDDDIAALIDRALVDGERGLGGHRVSLEPEARAHLIRVADGDARTALNALELAAAIAERSEGAPHIDALLVEQALQQPTLLYDKSGDMHYDMASALTKSIRGTDPDASIYWLARMLEAGEDPMFVARRLVILAAEDVGLADPMALAVAVAAQQAAHFVGMPEGYLLLSEATLYLATAPKSNSALTAYRRVLEDVEATRNQPVPLHLRNAVTGLDRAIGEGVGYKYAHAFAHHYVDQQYLPDELRGRRYYEPTDQGREAEIAARLHRLTGSRAAVDEGE